ncbi:excinuclease ABC subunit UvrA, partial [Ralstonia pseudosolanacearum]
MPAEGNIIIRRAKVNNLKDITVEIPRNRLVVVTGISGSGKSSLAFDTLFAEGQRRFAESLSSYARQFLGRMSKPDVEMIEGIPPAIAIEQKVNIRNPRSTVATTTEIYDFLRLLYARIGRTYSPVSGQ